MASSTYMVWMAATSLEWACRCLRRAPHRIAVCRRVARSRQVHTRSAQPAVCISAFVPVMTGFGTVQGWHASRCMPQVHLRWRSTSATSPAATSSCTSPQIASPHTVRASLAHVWCGALGVVHLNFKVCENAMLRALAQKQDACVHACTVASGGSHAGHERLARPSCTILTAWDLTHTHT